MDAAGVLWMRRGCCGCGGGDVDVAGVMWMWRVMCICTWMSPTLAQRRSGSVKWKCVDGIGDVIEGKCHGI